MFLKSLTIQNEEEVIRHIPFHKGINLIVDETKSEDKTESGNSVGKTTVLRLIDFCLAGDGKNIYTDSEFKTTNTKVENFLKKNNIIIKLILVNDINNLSSSEIVIEKNFLSRKNKIQKINGIKKKDDEFSKELKELIFKTSSKHPTFKQLKSKNIRDEKNKIEQTIRVLNPFTKDVEYEALHLFWFGVDVDLSKEKLVREKKLEERLQSRLRRDSNLSQIKQSLIIVDEEIKKLNKKRNDFKLNKDYESDLQKLNSIKSGINIVFNRLSHLRMRVELIEESKKDLENNIATADTQKIKTLYEKAQVLVPNIQKTFEETLKFHNDMIRQKLKFITEDLPQLHKKISKEEFSLNLLLKKEKQLSDKLEQAGFVEGLESIVSELNVLHERKGTLEEQKNLWKKTLSNLKGIKEKLKLINEEIDDKDNLIQQSIAKFNSYFSDISNRLYGVRSLLSAEKVHDVYKFEIGNIEGNPGTGGKKNQMASFDLAYINFADRNAIPCLHFVLQDQIENVHANQISNLLTKIVNEINCQYVLPVLRDKLPQDIDIREMEILSLSQDDKLFKT